MTDALEREQWGLSRIKMKTQEPATQCNINIFDVVFKCGFMFL